MKYGKITDGKLEFAPSIVNLDGYTIINPEHEQLITLGYKPVITDNIPTPQEGYYMEISYEETENEILQQWEEIELPPVEQTAGEYLLEQLGF